MTLDSEYIQEMRNFLTQNDIPIHGFGSDCQYSDDDTSFACYYTTNLDVCSK